MIKGRASASGPAFSLFAADTSMGMAMVPT